MAASPNIQGAILMTGSMAAFTFNDTFFKLLGDHLPFYQVLFLRSLGVTMLLFLLARVQGAWILPRDPKDLKLVLLRTLAEVAAAYFFLTALINMPLANVTAIIQALPLTVTFGAALVLRETVGWRRILAISIGLIGVLLIVRPGGEGFTVYSIYAVTAVVCVTVRDLAVRRMSLDMPSTSVAFLAACGVLVYSAIGLVFSETLPMTGTDMMLLCGTTICILCAYLFSVMAMRVGDVGFVAPFRYSSLLAALVLGFLVFGDWPDGWTLIGAGIVVATGLFTLWRERQVRTDPQKA